MIAFQVLLLVSLVLRILLSMQRAACTAQSTAAIVEIPALCNLQPLRLSSFVLLFLVFISSSSSWIIVSPYVDLRTENFLLSIFILRGRDFNVFNLRI